MKDSKKTAKIMAILLTVILAATFFIPAFATLASADEISNTAQDGESSVKSTDIDTSQDAYITSFSVDGDGVLAEGGEGKKVTVVISDNRIKGTGNVKVKISPLSGAFTSDAVGEITTLKTSSGLSYTIDFVNCKYLGGTAEFKFDISYTEDDGTSIAVPIKTITHTVSQVTGPAPSPTPVSQEVEIDASKEVFIQSYKISDKATNKELTVASPGQSVKLRFTVIDNRVTYLTSAPKIRARMSQGSFKNNNLGDVKYNIVDAGTLNGRKILAYQVEFDNVVYLGGSKSTAFDVSYSTGSGPLNVPYTELKQDITQAVDDVPEPKVILNSANYGGVAYVDRAFTLSTVATNTSGNIDLENVSVKVDLPAGLAVADGNSQALIGTVPKGGQIKHDFKLIITGVNNDVTSLPVNVIYEFEAYVKGERKTYKSEQSVAINVEQETKFEISKLEHMEAVTAGEEDTITVYLLNRGKTSANNVTVEIQSEQLNGPQTVFAGNITPGTESTQDIYFTVSQPGTFSGKVIVTYENAKGKQSTLEKEFTMDVLEAFDPGMDAPIIDEPIMEEEPKKFPWPIIAVVVIAAAAGAAVVIVKKRKAKENAEDEDEDI